MTTPKLLPFTSPPPIVEDKVEDENVGTVVSLRPHEWNLTGLPYSGSTDLSQTATACNAMAGSSAPLPILGVFLVEANEVPLFELNRDEDVGRGGRERTRVGQPSSSASTRRPSAIPNTAVTNQR